MTKKDMPMDELKAMKDEIAKAIESITEKHNFDIIGFNFSAVDKNCKATTFSRMNEKGMTEKHALALFDATIDSWRKLTTDINKTRKS